MKHLILRKLCGMSCICMMVYYTTNSVISLFLGLLWHYVMSSTKMNPKSNNTQETFLTLLRNTASLIVITFSSVYFYPKRFLIHSYLSACAADTA